MGFKWYTDEQRLRINLSQKAYQTMLEDMMLFQEKERSTFINRVFKNFHEQAKASSYQYLLRKREDFLLRISDVSCDESTKMQILEALIDHEKEILLNELEQQSHNKSVSKTYRINNENLEFLTGDECREDLFYDSRIALYLKCIMEEFVNLPYYIREKIYFKEYYDLAETAVQAERLLKLTLWNGTKYYVYPYKLDMDPLSTRYYLAGYSVPYSGSDKAKQICSFCLPRLKHMQILKQSGHLTRQNIADLEKAIENRSIQFLLGEEEEIRVYLTDAGITRYNMTMHLRPIKIPEKSTEHEYTFLCTPAQAEYYFFKFGSEAQILQPESLRVRFSQMYEAAAASYKNTLS